MTNGPAAASNSSHGVAAVVVVIVVDRSSVAAGSDVDHGDGLIEHGHVAEGGNR